MRGRLSPARYRRSILDGTCAGGRRPCTIGALREGTPLWTPISNLPRYLSDTFLHLDLGYDGVYQKQLSTVMFDQIPVGCERRSSCAGTRFGQRCRRCSAWSR
jgi:hypothetical protein